MFFVCDGDVEYLCKLLLVYLEAAAVVVGLDGDHTVYLVFLKLHDVRTYGVLHGLTVYEVAVLVYVHVSLYQ